MARDNRSSQVPKNQINQLCASLLASSKSLQPRRGICTKPPLVSQPTLFHEHPIIAINLFAAAQSTNLILNTTCNKIIVFACLYSALDLKICRFSRLGLENGDREEDGEWDQIRIIPTSTQEKTRKAASSISITPPSPNASCISAPRPLSHRRPYSTPPRAIITTRL